MYKLDPINHKTISRGFEQLLKNHVLLALLFATIVVIVFSFYFHTISLRSIADVFRLATQEITQTEPQSTASTEYVSRLSYEQAIIDSVKTASPSVVSIIISKNLPVYEQQLINPFGEDSPFEFLVPEQVQKGTKYQEVGAGSGFIVSQDGLILTNKHVVSDTKADYVAITSDGKKYETAVVALDPVSDIAVIKIKNAKEGQTFSAIAMGDSDGIQIGQGAIAIGNALGQFSNTVSVGVVSGLGRTVSASSQGSTFSETLENIIQTDAAINAGNSGGPLLNLRGEVIGVNTAMAQGAQSIGFAIPINLAKKDLAQIIKTNKIVYPFLGVRYVLVDEKIQKKYGLAVDYGALVIKGDNGEVAITKGSAAEKAGIKEKDVILEIGGQRISQQRSMAGIIQQYNPGDTIMLKVVRDGKEIDIEATLGER